jgi:hypothetical protein
VALAWNRVERRGWMEFLVAAVIVAVPWYLRNWSRTGNPLYSLELGGLFPVNPVHVDYMRAVAETKGLHDDAFSPAELGCIVALLAGIPLLIGIVAGFARWRKHAPSVLAIFAVVGLWLQSINYTSGGIIYSLRVLTPAMAIGAVLGGVWIASWSSSHLRRFVVLLVAAAAIDSAARSLSLPAEPQVAWWRQSPLAWYQWAEFKARWENHPNWQALVDAADKHTIVVSDPVCHAILTRHGGHAVPIFSPAVRFLFEKEMDHNMARARLRQEGVRFIMLTRKNPIHDRHLDQYPFFGALEDRKPVLSAPLYSVYDLYQLDAK